MDLLDYNFIALVLAAAVVIAAISMHGILNKWMMRIAIAGGVLQIILILNKIFI